MQRGGEEGGKSHREEQREWSYAERRRRGSEVMQGRAEGGESCKAGAPREKSHAGRSRVKGVMQEGKEKRRESCKWGSNGRGVMQGGEEVGESLPREEKRKMSPAGGG